MRRFAYWQGGVTDPPLPCEMLPAPEWQLLGPGFYRAEIRLPGLSSDARLIPSLSAPGEQPHGFRFALHENRQWRTLDAVGELDISLAEIAGGIEVVENEIAEDPNIDFFDLATIHSSSRPQPGSIPEPFRLMLFFKTALSMPPVDIPLVLAVSLTSLESGGWIPAEAGMTMVDSINVVPLSQMEQDPAIARHICSPVSTLMVARYLTGREIALPAFVAAAHSQQRRMYGIWPRAIDAAARQGVAGMVTVLAGWEEVAALLHAGLPVVASLAYPAGELAGAAVAATRGHLVTIIGLTETTVVVNDPAAPTAAEVRREYDLAEFAKAWFGNKRGVCYVLWKSF